MEIWIRRDVKVLQVLSSRLAGDRDDLYLEIYTLEETTFSRNEMTSMRDRYPSGKTSASYARNERSNADE